MARTRSTAARHSSTHPIRLSVWRRLDGTRHADPRRLRHAGGGPPPGSRTSSISKASARTSWSVTGWWSGSTAPATTSRKKSPFTRESLIGMLERLGVKVNRSNEDLETKNLAAVMVTATLPAFARQGGEIDITVASLGDATSLQGGTLLATPLIGADGEVYAVGQGNITIGGFKATGAAESVVRGVPDQRPHRAWRHRRARDPVRAQLHHRPEALAAQRRLHHGTAHLRRDQRRDRRRHRPVSLDSGTVDLNAGQYPGGAAALITNIEQLPVEPDQQAPRRDRRE